jgi:quinoprotein glucose dehydrogenase
VFGGGGDTAVHAVNAKTGEELWRYDTGELRVNATPMTYRLRGRQYLVIAVGGPGPGATLLAFALADAAAAPATPLPMWSPRRPAIRDTPWLSGWPAGDAQRIAARACSQCHAPGVVQASRLTRAQWASQVDAMIARGAQLDDAEIEPLLDYLATHFGAPAHW